MTETHALREFAERERIDLTIVGPEAPLAAGLVNEFEQYGLAIAGPRQEAARLESSKAFAKTFMARHHIPTAKFRIADSMLEALEILRRGEISSNDAPVVIKADGLAAGKGVYIASSRAEAEKTIIGLIEKGQTSAEAWRRIVIEEALEGREASLLLWTDGRDFQLMPAARDHKRIGENDTGPNTGGMGAITAPGVLTPEAQARVVSEIIEPTLSGAHAEGFEFRGVLFIGLMLTKEGPRVLEYNVRFGDPEAQAILVRLKSDLAGVFLSVTGQESLRQTRLEWSPDPSACVVLAAPGYPEQTRLGARIEGLEQAAKQSSVQIFHAGTRRAEDNSWRTAGGRVLGIATTGETLGEALRRCYDTIEDIYWDGMQFRRDIGDVRGQGSEDK